MNVGSDMNGHVSSVDTPFTAAELERLLRYNDVDASGLPIGCCAWPPTRLAIRRQTWRAMPTCGIWSPTPASIYRCRAWS